MIEKSTEKAILARIDSGMKKVTVWLPKSQITLEHEGSMSVNCSVPNWLVEKLISDGKLNRIHFC